MGGGGGGYPAEAGYAHPLLSWGRGGGEGVHPAMALGLSPAHPRPCLCLRGGGSAHFRPALESPPPRRRTRAGGVAGALLRRSWRAEGEGLGGARRRRLFVTGQPAAAVAAQV